MATRIDVTQTYQAEPAAVLRMLTDDSYAQLRAERTGAISATVTRTSSGDATTIVIDRVLPADVPAFAKSFLGETISIVETQQWGAPAADGSASASVTGTFSAPLTFEGAMEIAGGGGQTTVRTTGTVQANVPLVGGKVEGIAKDTMERYLHKEISIAEAWLADHP